MPFVLAAIGALVVAWLIALALNCLALRSWRKTENAHWTERARRLYPIHRSAGWNIWLIAALCGAIAWGFFPTHRDAWGLGLVVAAGWVGAYLGMYPLAKSLFPQFLFFDWLKQVIATWILRTGLIGILVVGAVIMPTEIGWKGIVLALGILGFQIAIHYGLWFWFGAKLGIFERAKDSERIAKIVRENSERMKIPYRTIWKFHSPMGYAAAFPMVRDLLFSEGFLNTHPDEEIAAVCAHELAHLSEPRRTHYVRLVTALGLFPLIFIRPAVHAMGPTGLALLWMPGCFLSIYVGKLGRKMEVRADSMANENQAAEGVYARALERLYRNNQTPAVMPGNRRVHPHLYDRLVAAGVTPDYPRPKPPTSLSWSSRFIMFVLVILMMVILVMRVREDFRITNWQ